MRAASATELLIDTDVLVDHVRGRRRLPIERRFAYSVVSRLELFAGNAADEHAVKDLLDPHRELPIDRAVAENAGRLRREGRIAVADALIAATALAHDLDLVTRNRRDFERVRGLRMRDPSSLT